MKFYKNNKLSNREKIKLVEDYLEKKGSLRKLASVCGISHQTLRNWVNLYKKFGKEGVEKNKSIKKKIPQDIEKRIMLLKEQIPSLSIKKAKKLLNEIGIKVSEKGIWRVWRDYGLINNKRKKEKGIISFLFVQPTPELEDKLLLVKKFVKKNDYKIAAKIINNIPALPESPILREIPEKFLTLRRRLERLCLEMGEIPYPQFLKKVSFIRKKLENKGYIYSSIITDFLELDALGWMRKIEQTIPVFERLEKKLRGVKDRALWFLFYYEKASTCCLLLKMTEALKYIKKCRELLYSLPYPYYWEYYGDLLTYLGEYKKALFFYKKAYEKETDPQILSRLALKIASYGYGMDGDYIKCKKMLTKAVHIKSSLIFGANYSLINAYLSLIEGNLNKAAQLFQESLKNAKRGELYNYLYATYIGFANIAMMLRNKKKAGNYLKKALSFMRKYKIGPHTLVLKGLLGKIVNIPQEFLCSVSLRLLHLIIKAKNTMKVSDYQKIIKFAKRKGVLGIFHRWILFFPEIVLNVIKKGKKTELPKKILKSPIFNKEIIVYHIKFLGNLLVYKNQQLLKIDLTPQEEAFLTKIALQMSEPGKSILVEELYENFWPKSKNPYDRLSHLLTTIKKKIILPKHLIGVSSKYGEIRLFNYGIYFTTDQEEFEQTLARAKAMEQLGKWKLACKEYLQGFNLFRDAPFKKNFDRWSLDTRFKLLTKLETETISFVQSCFKNGDVEIAKKVLIKVSKILPHSQEVKNLLKVISNKKSKI